MKEISSSELLRLYQISSAEIRLAKEGFLRIAGVDEAGRGPLAGPVVAAACILPPGSLFEKLNDSKKLSEAQRDSLFSQITTHPSVVFGIGIVDVETIDQINILQATLLAMKRAVEAISPSPDYVLIDGNQFPDINILSECMVQGDSKSISIAAASIIAKVMRDRMMDELDEIYPMYGFKKHKGYGTAAHLEALKLHGPSPVHRTSFAPIRTLCLA